MKIRTIAGGRICQNINGILSFDQSFYVVLMYVITLILWELVKTITLDLFVSERF